MSQKVESSSEIIVLEKSGVIIIKNEKTNFSPSKSFSGSSYISSNSDDNSDDDSKDEIIIRGSAKSDDMLEYNATNHFTNRLYNGSHLNESLEKLQNGDMITKLKNKKLEGMC